MAYGCLRKRKLYEAYALDLGRPAIELESVESRTPSPAQFVSTSHATVKFSFAWGRGVREAEWRNEDAWVYQGQYCVPVQDPDENLLVHSLPGKPPDGVIFGYAPGMAAKITEDGWRPLPGALPENVEAEKIYVIPMRMPMDADADATPRYTDTVRYLPKEARAAGIPLEFATGENKRKYLQEFSAGPDIWALGLALLTITSDWVIFSVQQFIHTRARAEGWTHEEAQELPLKVSIAETGTSRNIEIEGSGAEVLEALRLLQRNSPEQLEDGHNGQD